MNNLPNRKLYTAPELSDYGDIADLTATLGSPFSGDVSFDVDGNILEEGMGSTNQCPTRDNETCLPDIP